MKKTTWLLLAISVVAMLLVAGCTPTTPAPTASPTPTPTATPTTPPADKECPKVVVKSTTVTEGYWTLIGGNAVKLTVTFNEPVTSNCIENPDRWDITVKNSGRRDTEITESEDLDILWVLLSADGKKADVYFDVWETLSYVVKDVVYQIDGESGIAEGVFPVNEWFYGLICSEDEAKDYATPSNAGVLWAARNAITGMTDAQIVAAVNEALGTNYNINTIPLGAILSVFKIELLDYDLVSGPGAPKYADAVEWKLKDCVVADELGNACCDYSGSVCCIETTCAECEEGCTWGSESSCP